MRHRIAWSLFWAASAACLTATALAQPPPAPSSCTSHIVSESQLKGVQFGWTDVANEDGYRIYRNGTLVATLGPNVESFFDCEYPVPGDFPYCVEAFNGWGASPQCCAPASNTLLSDAWVEPCDWFHDTFPFTDNDALPGTAAFDTCVSFIKTGRNIAPLTGDLFRFDVPGDAVVLRTSGDVARVDLVFRILPGPGNYHTLGLRSSGLRKVPSDPIGIATPGDGSFWGTYLADNGAFGTGGDGNNGPGQTHGRIVVANDDCTLSDVGFAHAPTTAQFALNVANWFRRHPTGHFLVRSNNSALTDPMLSTTMTNAGHTWTINPAAPDGAVADLLPYDGVFLCQTPTNLETLKGYVRAGGCVYLAGGGPGDATAWDAFLAAFGLDLGNPNGLVGNFPISSSHPLFQGVTSLYQNDGNDVVDLDGADPANQVLVASGTHGLYGIFEGRDGWDPDRWNSHQCKEDAPGIFTTYDPVDGTKIIPDGLLTPGSHVEYYFRVQKNGGQVILLPDPSKVLQIDGERSIDGHRWQEFSVLPDRWKEPAYGGRGNPVMLYVDQADRLGNERVWVEIAEAIGATAAAKYGAHNGWTTRGGCANPDDPACFVNTHGGQAGTTWDMYGVRGAEALLDGHAGSLGSRLSYRVPGPMFDQVSRIGPTPRMLDAYYSMILILTADLRAGIFGPFEDRSQDEVRLLEDFLTRGTPAYPHGLFIEGENFVECEWNVGATHFEHRDLLQNFLGLSLRDPDYRALSGNDNPMTWIATRPPHDPSSYYDVQNNADGDVLQLLPPTPSIYSAAEWQDWGTEGPYTASVYHPNDPAFPWRPWITLVDAWNIAHLGGGTGCVALGPGVTRSTGSLFAVTGTTSATARYVYFFETLTNLFARFPVTAGQPVDVPNPSHGDRGGPIVAFGLTNTPLRAGATMVRLQFGWPDHVRVQILDAAGRRVRTLADREFEAGAIELMWNGTDDAGRALPSGLYFAQVMCHRSDISQAKKFVILR